MKYIHAALTFVTIILCGCSKKQTDTVILTASISPVKYIVETITCGDFPVEIMVPDGASPESYSPTANQLVDIERSKLIFTTGLLDFEQELVSRLSGDKERIVDLSDGVSIMNGSCSHSHYDGELHDNEDINNTGIDPHIWTSPEQLKIMASNAYKAIAKQFPDSLKYAAAYDKMVSDLEILSSEIASKIEKSGVKYFIIYHPALTYYARDYGLTQLPLEDEGKEPSAHHMRNIIELAHDNDIKFILYQRQFSRSVVETIAADIDAQSIEIDPLNLNIINEITKITDIITSR